MDCYDTELTAYRLLRLFGVVRVCINSESTPLHPITDVVEGLALEYIPGVSMENLNRGSTSPSKRQRGYPAKCWKDSVPSRQRTACCTMIFILENVVVPEGNRSAVIIDFGQAIIRAERSDEEWLSVVHGRCRYTIYEEESHGSRVWRVEEDGDHLST